VAVRISRVSLLLGSLLAAGPAQAATFVVDDTGDAADAGINGICDAIGPAGCTLRAAIQEANATVPADTINFNIPGPGPYTITPLSVLNTIIRPVTIDGTTQPGYAGTPIIELNGASAGGPCPGTCVDGLGFGTGSGGSTVRGLVVNRFSNVQINLFSGANGIAVVGSYIGTDATGAVGLGGVNDGVRIASNNNTIGGTLVADRNVISGNGDNGVQFDPVSNNTVLGNYIGTNAAGTAAIGNGSCGVEARPGATNSTIGGTAAGAGNLISGHSNWGGVCLDAGTSGIVVTGNRIGTNAAGAAAVGNYVGVWIEGSGHTIGGTAAGAANRIAYNLNNGVALTPTAGTGNQISSNEIYSNGALGIDLDEDGVTANDVGDGDTGANNLQNYPVLSAAMTNGLGSANIAGSLNSAAGTTYRVEFFATSAAASRDEGERFLGFANVATDASGNAVFGVTLAASVTAGEFVTATATDPTNNTSEFSADKVAVGLLVVTTTADTVNGTTTSTSALVANPGADGRISLREAILATNATAGNDTIEFGIPLTDANHLFYANDGIPGSLTLVNTTTLTDTAITFDPDYPAGLARSWYRIRPTSALPTVGDAVILDGATQPGFLVGGPVVELDGSLIASPVDGLRMTAGTSTVNALVINGFQRDGLRLSGPGAYSVTGNYLGTDVSGTKAAANFGSGVYFLQLTGAASTVGGATTAARNTISGNGGPGVSLYAFDAPGITSQVRIQGNYIGTDVTGTAGLNVQVRGIYAEFTGGHLIGGAGPGEGNLISGNAGDGIDLNGNNGGGAGTPANNNVIEGNRIGTNAAGTGAIGNGGRGILMYANANPLSEASNNVIRGNVIAAAGLGMNGIHIRGNADNNLIESNFIGTDSSGTLDLGNTGSGIQIQSDPSFLATGNTIRNNVIRFNDADGVRILGDSSVTLTQNQIWSNDGLGLNLNADGVTANDPGDTDVGPNSLLNFPFPRRSTPAAP